MNLSYQKNNKESQPFIFGIHPIVLSLEQPSGSHKELFIQKDLNTPMIKKIKGLAISKAIKMQEKVKKDLDILTNNENHQGVVLLTDRFIEYTNLNDMASKNCVLILDHLDDPHNLGAILRTCEQFGVDGVVITKNRSVGVTATVVKVSSGAAFLVPIMLESSLIHVIERLKEFGFWIYTTDVNDGQAIYNVKFTEKVAIIIGNESQGVSLQLAKKADFKIKIPSYSKNKNTTVDSLNVSVATGIILYSLNAFRDINS